MLFLKPLLKGGAPRNGMSCDSVYVCVCGGDSARRTGRQNLPLPLYRRVGTQVKRGGENFIQFILFAADLHALPEGPLMLRNGFIREGHALMWEVGWGL